MPEQCRDCPCMKERGGYSYVPTFHYECISECVADDTEPCPLYDLETKEDEEGHNGTA